MKIFITENIIKEDIDYSSFFPKDELCPYIFHANSQIKKDIRKSLLEIANDFYDFMELDWLEDGIKDVWLVGSLASYNWSELYSDLDLHIILDYSEISEDKRIVENMMWSMKALYGEQHNISIEGFDVELYGQNVGEQIESDGIYSVLRQTWIKKPIKRELNVKKASIEKYTKPIESEVEKTLTQYRLGNYKKAGLSADNLEDQIYNLRKLGLAQGGEFDVRNLAFKALRRNKTLEKLKQVQIKGFDKTVSIEDDELPSTDGEIKPTTLPNKSAPIKNKNIVKGKQDEPKKDQIPAKAKEESDDEYTDGIAYTINGRKFSSLRDAEKELGVPKSTLEYRVNSDTPKWSAYKKIT